MIRRLILELGRFGVECAIGAFACTAAVVLAVALLGSLALGHLIEVVNPGYARRARELETPARLADGFWSRMHYTRG